MNFEKNNSRPAKPRVLVAPLDWGLGHATRCIPVICGLQKEGVTVYVAASGAVKALLEKELGQVIFLPLAGYNIRYTKSRGLLPFAILWQLPKILLGVYKERRWLKKGVTQYRFDAVISDNRPGLYNHSVPCIYITHQLTIKTGTAFTGWVAQKMHYYFISKYTACWVPDNAEKNILAGDLSHPKKLPKTPLHYLGPLSRFEKDEAVKKYDLLILLSGPEPQRTVFEKLLLKELAVCTGNILLVRGLPGTAPLLTLHNKSAEVYNHLPAATLGLAIRQSEVVICRSGYTTVMDLICLGQKAVLVPTPGQTEQEYLAKYLMEEKLFPSITQENFSISKALEAAEVFPFAEMDTGFHQYEKTIQDLVLSLKKDQ